MDPGRYGQPAFTTGNTGLHCHSRMIPSLVSEVPFYTHQGLNPNVPPPLHSFRDSPTGSPPPPLLPAYSPQTGWNGLNGGINLNHGTTNYAQNTTIRWPRQETLALLEIRSRLDPCFKEAISTNHKAPLWDEISRMMNEEYGYLRSGRKCKEKFENLYKYYKKTKDGKVGKHDGKHYRFFRQLESLFGDQHDLRSINSNISIHPNSQSNYSSEYGTPSFEKNRSNHKFKNKELIAAIEESMESQFLKLMDKQDEFGKKMLCTIERKEQERLVGEEEWRKHEGARLDHECEAWASHVARIETRDKCLLNSLENLIRVRSTGSSYRNMDPMENSNDNGCHSINDEKHKDWIEAEICSLIHIRTEKSCRFHDGSREHGEGLWEEVAFELSLLGYKRSESDCKETWEKICVDFNKTKKEDSSRRSNSMEDEDDRNSCFSATAMNIDGNRSLETM